MRIGVLPKIMAVDGEYQWREATFQGEYARARIEIPTSLAGLFAETQQGFYGQAMYIVWRKVLPMFPKSSLSIGGRYDYVDFDTTVRGDDVRRLSVVTNLRLVPETVLKLDYQHNWIFDRLNNQTRAAVIQFGIATYF